MLDVTNLTKRTTPKLPFRGIKEKILGKKYELSLVLAGGRLMRKLNKERRGKDIEADTLSFSFSDKEGEIFINAKTTREKMLFLFVHSLLHLKGLKHSEKMEKEEKDWHNKLKLA